MATMKIGLRFCVQVIFVFYLSLCQARIAPDPGFCTLVVQCQDTRTTASETPETPATPSLDLTAEPVVPSGNQSAANSTVTSSCSPCPSVDCAPCPGTSTSARPTPSGALLVDPNGPLRCREAQEQPVKGAQQPLGAGEKEVPGMVPGSYHGRIPCSSARKQKPCLGGLHRDWDYAKLEWSKAQPRSGWPQPWVLPPDVYTQTPIILEIVDWQFQTSHYRVLIDGEVVDESDEEGYRNEDLQCDQPDVCVEKGFGHAFAFIPQSSSQVIIENTDGTTVYNSGNEHVYEEIAWRLWEPCQC